MNPDTTIGGSSKKFPETIWGAVLGAKTRDSNNYRANLDYLISNYWKPVYYYIRIGWKKSNDEAKDLTQEFFTAFMEKDYLQYVDPDKGKFRTFVRTALKHFLIKADRSGKTQKRGGNKTNINFDEVRHEIRDNEGPGDPQTIFDIKWADTLLNKAMEKIKQKLADENKEIYIKVFNAYNSITNNERTYSSVAKLFKIKDSDVRNYLTYMRSLMRKFIKEEISKYLIDPSDAEEELQYMLAIKTRL